VIRPVIAITASTAAAPRTKAPATAPDSAAGLTLIGGRSIQRTTERVGASSSMSSR